MDLRLCGKVAPVASRSKFANLGVSGGLAQ